MRDGRVTSENRITITSYSGACCKSQRVARAVVEFSVSRPLGVRACHVAAVRAIRYSRGVHYAGARPHPLPHPVRPSSRRSLPPSTGVAMATVFIGRAAAAADADNSDALSLLLSRIG